MDNQYIKGRGALTNRESRYSHTNSIAVDDGWYQEEVEVSPNTQVIRDAGKSIISENQSPDIPFFRSINPYRGCEHGCIYCYARPTHAYWGMSPGLDFETKIVVKESAAELLEQELTRKSYVCHPITIGANTDPYQPLEKSYLITRRIIETLQRYRHPFSIITKGSLILRDLDILSEMAAANLCSVAVSLTSLDNDLKRIMEPRAASASARLRVIESLSREGVPVAVMVAPVIPAINDHEIESILEAASQAGARSAAYVFLRLPREISELFREWLQEHFPDRKDKVMNLIRQSRGMRDYQGEFGLRMRGSGAIAELISRRFAVAVKRLGLNQQSQEPLDTSQFSKPNLQRSLFDL